MIPCSGKKVCTRNFAQYAHRLPIETELNFFNTYFAHHNIALMMGPINKLLCIDIDTNDPEVSDMVLDTCGDTVSKFGSKGMTYIYKVDYIPKNMMFVSKEHGCMLEFLCNGRFTVIPPSKHPNGLNYEWTSEKDLLESYDHLPSIDKKSLEKIEAYMRSKHDCMELKELLKLKAA